jgi:hypothetical protein
MIGSTRCFSKGMDARLLLLLLLPTVEMARFVARSGQGLFSALASHVGQKMRGRLDLIIYNLKLYRFLKLPRKK